MIVYGYMEYPNEWDEDIIINDIEKAWKEYELHKQIEAIERERAVRATERKWQIERIAKEAAVKHISASLCFKFFKEYNITPKEQTVFWYYYSEVMGINKYCYYINVL